MDLIELTRPYLAIITVSLDRKIRCFQDYLKTWVINENACLRQLDYTEDFGGALLVSGFQTYFAVWDIQDCVSFAKDQIVRKEIGVRG